MNKNLSLAIEKAVEKATPTNNFPHQKELGGKKPDLFSLTTQTELFQNDKGITIKIDRKKDEKLTDFGKATLSDRYLGENESYQDLFARVSSRYADDNLHAQRIYNYISNLWFMPATPILSILLKFCVKTTTCCVHFVLIYYIYIQINRTLYEHFYNSKDKI